MRKLHLVILLLLLLTCLPLAAKDGRITMTFRNEPLSSAFTRLEKATDYKFSYVYDDIQGFRVTATVKNQTIDGTMQTLLNGLPLSYVVRGNIVNVRRVRRVNQAAKPRDIFGIVKDENGDPLPGATIVSSTGSNVMGGSEGATAVTDVNGHFRLTVSEEMPSILVRFMGFKDKVVRLSPRISSYEISLEPDQQTVDEVVVNGAFTRKANTFSGSVTSVSGDQLRTIGNQNVLQSLKNLDPSFMQTENLSAGSNPNSMPDYQMRGASTVSNVQGEYASSANQPLFILDGFETELTKIMDLDMNQVKSVTLLKDATAKAIYGSKAANGVIVIETIRPSSGKLRISYTGEVNIEAPDLSSYQLANAQEKLEVERLAGLYTDKNGNITNQLRLDAAYSSRLAEIVAGVNTDWLAKPVRTGVGQKHSLYLEGGDQAMQYGVNLMYNNIAGAMKGSERNTFSGGITLSYRVKKLEFRNKLTIDYNSADESPYGSFSQYALMNPYSRIYDTDGSMVKVYDYTGTSGSVSAYNPLYNTTLNTINNSKYTTITDNFYTEWQVLEGLKLTGRFGLVHKTTTSDLFKPANHTDFISTTDVFAKGSYQKGDGTYTDISADLGANFGKQWGKHLVFLNGQLSLTSNKYNTTLVEAVGFPNDFMNDISYAVQYAKNSSPSGTEGLSRTIGGLASLNYSYDERYLFDANYRLTGSSETSSDNRWGQFWSVGGGWNVQNEKFMKPLRWLSKLKLRASYGYTGSQGFSVYDSQATFTYNTSRSYNGRIGSYVTRLANDDLKWQEKYDLNIGVDVSVLNNRLSGRFDWYRSTTDGMITSVTVPHTTGFTTYVANLGKVENKGWEAYLNGMLMNKGRNYINVFAAIAHNTNTLKKISNSLRAWNDAQDANMLKNKVTTPSVKYYEGCSMTAIWAVPSLGIDPQNGKEIYVKKDGTVTYDYDMSDQVVCGDTQPKYNGTIGFNGEWKGWGFSVTGSYRWGGQIFNTTLVNKVENCNVAYNVDKRVLSNRWQKPGDVALYKAITDFSTTYPTSRFVQDYNLFTLSTLSVYYDFYNCKFVKNSFLERLKVTAYTTDLFNISSVKIERGTDYPYARTFSLSVQVTL